MKSLIRPDRRGPVATLGIVALATAWVFAGFRNMPRLTHPQSAAAGAVIAGSLYIAFRIGQRSVKATAVAAAVASAEATAVAAAAARSTSTSTANVAVVVSPEFGAAAVGRHRHGLEDAPWIVGAASPALSLEEAEGLTAALEDVTPEHDWEATL